MRRPFTAALIAAPALLIATPALAQDATDPHAGMDHGSMDMSEMDHSGMDHAGMDMSAPEPDAADEGAESTAVAEPAAHAGHNAASAPSPADTPGNAPPPPAPADMAAEAFYPRAVMQRSLNATLAEMRFRGSAVQVDQLEYRANNGKDGYGFEGMAWYGGDIDRAVLGFRGEGAFGETPETLELSGTWRHALDPWYNLQLGLRQDLGAGPDRTYALIGIEGLAPYWLEVDGQLLLSNKGDVRARAGVATNLRITNRLILEPEAEIDLAFQDIPELAIASGLEKIELSARLRYEFSGMFAPYVGVFWERKLGDTARLARAQGEGAGTVSAVAGVRFAF
ncbi:copper resistance protein B [Novosphingobium colocasiae]|uniref:copper resistance protein B n=1 Tax=Novosphingobium colocasiae TaxID=1256513 RepID=UPI0035AF4E3D